MSNVVEQIVLFQKKLTKYSATNEIDKLLYYIHKLKHLNIRVSHLEETGIGRSVNALRQQRGIVAEKAKALVNKWKDMVNEEEEEDEEECEPEDENNDRQQADHILPNKGAQLYTTDDQESEGGVREEEEEEDRLQIQEDQDTTRDYKEDHYRYNHHSEDSTTAVRYGYQHQQDNSGSEGEEKDSYNPLTSQRDYQSQFRPVATDYHPSTCRADSPDLPPSPRWGDASPAESSNRKNGSSSKSSSKKSSSKSDKEREKHKDKGREEQKDKGREEHKDRGKEEHKDRGREKHKDRGREEHRELSSGNFDQERKKHHKEKHKHRDREESKEEKAKSHRDKDRHSEKLKENKHHRDEEYNKSKVEKPDKSFVINGYSSPDIEQRSCSDKEWRESDKESRESDKRGMDEKGKDKSDRSSSSSSSSHKKDSSSHRESSISSEHRGVRLSDDRENERTGGDSERGKENSRNSVDKDREKRTKEKHRDKDRSSSDHREKHQDNESRKNVDGKSENSKKDKEKKRSKGQADIDFGAVLMGLDSPSKKKKKKKKELVRERESSEDEQPSTSSSSNKRILADGGGLPDPKKSKLLTMPSHKLPKLQLPSVILDEKPFLPEITPNYKPLPRVALRDEANLGMSKMSEEEAMNVMFQSKCKRSKVYSGKVSGLSYVPSLYEICIRVLQENIDAIEMTGGIPFFLLRPVLERASAQQLLNLEDFNSYLLEDTNVLWEAHCKRDFKTKKREEMETWRDAWIRCFEERESKLKNLTQNLQQKFISNSKPKSQTKLAFVGSNIKVPKNVARAQAKYGTAPSPTVQTGKVNEVAARMKAMQNAQRAEKAPNPRPTAAKKKKVAPMMAKTRQFFKKAFRR